MPTLNTVRICDPQSPGEYLNINEVDFDGGRHELWSEDQESSPKKTTKKKASKKG